jgi:hypothetical protein
MTHIDYVKSIEFKVRAEMLKAKLMEAQRRKTAWAFVLLMLSEEIGTHIS